MSDPFTVEKLAWVDQYINKVSGPELIGTSLTPPQIKTNGPDGRYGAILFIEKEGFLPLLEQAQVAERFDLAIMSTKGMSVTASRRWIDQVCGGVAKATLPVFCLHDFDPYGFTIYGTLTGDNRRYCYENNILVHDIGLRLSDIQELALPFETQHVRSNRASMAATARDYGATEDEIEAMFNGPTGTVQRVELNALRSDQLLNLIETRLREHNVSKVIPDLKMLEDVYGLYARHHRLRAKYDGEIARLADEPVKVPDSLDMRVQFFLQDCPTASWDTAVELICEQFMAEVARSESFTFELGGLHFTATIGRFSDGRIGELFLNNHKFGNQSDTNARDAPILLSFALQHGADIEAIRKALCRDGHGRALGPVGEAPDQIAGFNWGAP